MTTPRDVQVAVVGAGPAGMAAATTLARHGARVLVLDEAPRAGGQIYRQPPVGFTAPESRALHTPSHDRGHELLHDLETASVEVLHGVTVWNATPGVLEFESAGRGERCRWQHLIVATGAYDRVVPFPGWTLPGVITAGAAQVLVRGQLVTPGTRAVVAGTGPLLLPTLTALHAAGVEIVAGLEACSRWRAAGAVTGVVRTRTRRREAWHYLRTMLGGRIPLSMGHALFEVRGRENVETAVIGPVDAQGRPDRAKAREVAVDLVCTGYGLVPSIELAGVLGCDLVEVPHRGGWVVGHDEHMATSVPDVWVAGETAGVGGADVAAVEGRLAGLGVAARLGLLDAAAAEGEIRACRRTRERERRASDALLRAFRIPSGLLDLATDDTVVCRCEDVTLGAIREGMAIYGGDLRSAKMATRAGMGPCQGRICQPALGDLLTSRLGAEPPPGRPVFQAPIKPVSISTLIESADRDPGVDSP